MKVTITTPFACLSVEMDAMQAATLLTEALIAAVPVPEKTTEKRPYHGAYAGLFNNITDEDIESYTAPNEPAEPAVTELTTNKKEPPAGFSAEEPTPEKGYRGFLHMKCDHCHKEKSFHIKFPLKEYRCECGHTTPLHGLSKVVARCDCGWELKYYTNQDADAFELKCISCEKPVLVKWNFRRKRYEKAD